VAIGNPVLSQPAKPAAPASNLHVVEPTLSKPSKRPSWNQRPSGRFVTSKQQTDKPAHAIKLQRWRPALPSNSSSSARGQNK
jgi:hypothetical protein